MTAAIRSRFHDDGFVVLNGALPEDLVRSMVEAADNMLGRAAVAGIADDPIFEFEPGTRTVQRIKRPHAVHPFFGVLVRSPQLLDLVEPLIGPHIRLHSSKINVKAARIGSLLEWHQDWAFVPHSNLDLVIVGITIDHCGADSGPILLLPGSHKLGLINHHHDGVFYGAIDVAAQGLSLDRAVAVIGPPGTISIHHPLMVHGSGANRTQQPRRMLFLEFAAADAWPLYCEVDWDEYDSRILRGPSCNTARLEPAPVKMPFPRAAQGVVYNVQQNFAKKHFRAENEGR